MLQTTRTDSTEQSHNRTLQNILSNPVISRDAFQEPTPAELFQSPPFEICQHESSRMELVNNYVQNSSVELKDNVMDISEITCQTNQSIKQGQVIAYENRRKKGKPRLKDSSTMAEAKKIVSNISSHISALEPIGRRSRKCSAAVVAEPAAGPLQQMNMNIQIFNNSEQDDTKVGSKDEATVQSKRSKKAPTQVLDARPSEDPLLSAMDFMNMSGENQQERTRTLFKQLARPSVKENQPPVKAKKTTSKRQMLKQFCVPLEKTSYMRIHERSRSQGQPNRCRSQESGKRTADQESVTRFQKNLITTLQTEQQAFLQTKRSSSKHSRQMPPPSSAPKLLLEPARRQSHKPLTRSKSVEKKKKVDGKKKKEKKKLTQFISKGIKDLPTQMESKPPNPIISLDFQAHQPDLQSNLIKFMDSQRSETSVPPIQPADNIETINSPLCFRETSSQHLKEKLRPTAVQRGRQRSTQLRTLLPPTRSPNFQRSASNIPSSRDNSYQTRFSQKQMFRSFLTIRKSFEPSFVRRLSNPSKSRATSEECLRAKLRAHRIQDSQIKRFEETLRCPEEQVISFNRKERLLSNQTQHSRRVLSSDSIRVLNTLEDKQQPKIVNSNVDDFYRLNGLTIDERPKRKSKKRRSVSRKRITHPMNRDLPQTMVSMPVPLSQLQLSHQLSYPTSNGYNETGSTQILSPEQPRLWQPKQQVKSPRRQNSHFSGTNTLASSSLVSPKTVMIPGNLKKLEKRLANQKEFPALRFVAHAPMI